MGKVGKLEWEWGDRDDEITIRKKKGKITVAEIYEFMSSLEARFAFGEGTLWVIANRIKSDTYVGFEMEEPEGDAVDVWIIGDEQECFCGRVLHTSYCPKCGEKLF